MFDLVAKPEDLLLSMESVLAKAGINSPELNEKKKTKLPGVSETREKILKDKE